MSQFPMVGSVVTFTRLRETLFPNGWKNVAEKFQRLETLRGCAVVAALRAAGEGAAEKHRYKGLDCAPTSDHGDMDESHGQIHK